MPPDPPAQKPPLPLTTGVAGVGFILADQDLKPLYTDNYSLRILGYPKSGQEGPAFSLTDVQSRLRAILGERFTAESPALTSFQSGRRRYICRASLLSSQLEGVAGSTVAILFERQDRAWSVALVDAGRRFKLSQRELETVGHLVHGLTTKEIASRMNVSPNTIKQFMRLVMTKMNTTTRSGVLGKIFSS